MLFEVMECLREQNTVLPPQEGSRQTPMAKLGSCMPVDKNCYGKTGKVFRSVRELGEKLAVGNLKYRRQEEVCGA